MEKMINKQPFTTRIFDFLLSIGGIKRIRGHSFCLGMMQSNPIVLDLGAHKGEFSNLLYQAVNIKKVLCIEANPSLVDQIKHNLRHLPSCSVIHAAVSGRNSPQTIEFQISDNPEASSLNTSVSKTFGLASTVSVPVITLEEIIDHHLDDKSGKINLLKLDVEGAELDILQTVSDETLKNIEQITVEFHDFLNHEMLPVVIEIKNMLKNKHGFVCIEARWPQNDDVLFLNKELLTKHHGKLKFWARVFYTKFIFSLRSLIFNSKNHV